MNQWLVACGLFANVFLWALVGQRLLPNKIILLWTFQDDPNDPKW